MEPDHTPKNRNADDSGIRCATSYGLQGPKSSEISRSVALPGFPRIQQGGGVTSRRREGPFSSGFSRGGYMATLMAGHRKMEESKQVRDDPSTSQALITHQGRAQGTDQAPLAAIARVSAAKSETWILVLCLRMYSMKGVLTRGTNEETGSQVSWDGP